MISRDRRRDRQLATILFTDMVGSTEIAARIGDREWRRVVAAHHASVRAQLRKFGGREIDTAGDGFFASFEQPAQAVHAADAIVRELGSLGLALRAGVHTGETEIIGRKIGGIAVHIAARVVAAASSGQVLVSSTVRDLVAGSGLEFTDAGMHELKGVPTEWHLFALVRPDAASATPDAANAIGVPRAETGTEASPRRSRTVVLLVAGAFSLVSAVGVAAFAAGLFGGAPTAPSLSPGPNTVVVIDSDTGAVEDVFATPDGPVAIEADGSRLWIASVEDGVVVDRAIADASTGGPIGRVGRPTSLAVGNETIWVADAFGQTLTLIDSATGEVRDAVDNVVARDIAYGLDSLWATDDLADRVIRMDRLSGETTQSLDLPAGSYPRGISVTPTAIWVVNTGTSTVSRIDGATASVVAGAIPLRSVPDEVAAGTTDVWVTSRAGDAVLRIDPQTNSVSNTILVGDQPVALAVDGETIWVGLAGTHEVLHLDRDGNKLTTTAVGGVPTDIALAEDHVFVTVRGG